MDAAGIQAKVYAGYGKAAARLGYATSVYRASGPLNPLDAANLVATLPASFNAQDMHYRRPNGYGHPAWYCVADGRSLRVGDCLVSAKDGTFFIAAMQSQLPILAVQTNRTVSVLRPRGPSGVGAQGYGGLTAATQDTLMSGWPASVLQGGRGEHNDVNLPTDTRSPVWSVLLPAIAGVVLRTSDIVTDDLDRRYAIQSAELTDLGWRLIALQELA